MTEQLNLLDASTSPARSTDPATSHAAARQPFRRGTQRHTLLKEYRDADNLTDEEAAIAADIPRGCPWKRCSELRDLGLIVPTGSVRRSGLGSDQRVCRITDAGMTVLDSLDGPA